MQQSMIADLSGFQRDLLFVIASQDQANGLTIRDELEAYRDEKVHHGRLYPNLDDLVETGLVDKSKQTERSNSYSLTDAGAEIVESRVSWTINMSDMDTDDITTSTSDADSTTATEF